MIGNFGENLIFNFFRFICRIIFDFFAFYTGEIVLFVLTVGLKKPRWDYYSLERPTTFIIFTQISVWVGIVFWVIVLASFKIITF